MNSDIRISVSFRGHRKRLKLERLLGPGAVGYLVDLWIVCSMDRPTGDLSSLDDLDISLMAGWVGDPAMFLRALIDSGFLDKGEDGSLTLHDWEEHNPWAYHAKERSEMARQAALKRYAYKKHAKRIRNACETLKEGNAPSPNPSPNPSPKDKRVIGTTIPPEIDDIKAYCQERGNNIDAHRFFDYYAAKGWMIGKNRMKNWQAAIRTWESKNGDAPLPTARAKEKWERIMDGEIEP